jgi:pimeloyl-ACP methyl ester carboxylesterase
LPVLVRGNLQIDYVDEGHGKPAILVHSSVSGNRQWRSLADDFKKDYRVVAINLFGYGGTTPWDGRGSQTLADQASLVLALQETLGMPVYLVGHSFGASVALQAAALLGNQAAGLVLLNPNPFYLLAQNGKWDAYGEARAIRDHVKQFGLAGDWRRVAERFAAYWAGEGAWDAMSPKRQAAFIESLPPNLHEWDAVMIETTPIEEWSRIRAPTLVVYAEHDPRSIREIVALFRQACPHWSFREIASARHMAPLTHPELVNPIIAEFLESLNGYGGQTRLHSLSHGSQ